MQRCIFAVAALLFYTLPTFSQDILWEKSFGGRHAEYLADAVPTADYGFILAGSSLSSKSGNKTSDNEGDLDYWIWKMDEKGDPVWQKSFGGAGTDYLQSIKLTHDGGFILAGHSNSQKSESKLANTKGGFDYWIIKLDAGGGQQWQLTIGGNNDEKLQSIAQTKDGGYILGGSSYSDKSGDKKENSFGNIDYWIVKIDKEGKIQWQKTIGGKYVDELRSIAQTGDGGYILGGYSNSPESGNKINGNLGLGDFWIHKLNRDGDIEWERVIGGTQDEQLFTILQTLDGNYIVGGNSNSAATDSKTVGNGKGADFWLVKLLQDGTTKWQQTYDFGYFDILTSVVENKDQTLLIGGFAKSEPNTKHDDGGINDYIALKVSDEGNFLWSKTIGSKGDDVLKKLIETRDGGYLLAGTSNPIRSFYMSTQGKDKRNSKTKSALKLGNGQANQGLSDATNQVNEQIGEVAESVNQQYDKAVGGLTDKANNAIGSQKDSSLQFGLNKPSGLPIGNSPSLGNGGSGTDPMRDLMDGISKQQATLPASGDKKTNFGSGDFWVVKLRDKNKGIYQKVKNLEASPNPTSGFTNVIVKHDYQNGMATVVDLSGHILEQIPISGQTIPINLSGYPEGVYIINVKTDKESEGVKVIKTK